MGQPTVMYLFVFFISTAWQCLYLRRGNESQLQMIVLEIQTQTVQTHKQTIRLKICHNSPMQGQKLYLPVILKDNIISIRHKTRFSWLDIGMLWNSTIQKKKMPISDKLSFEDSSSSFGIKFGLPLVHPYTHTNLGIECHATLSKWYFE
jgi:hypothetical protein